MDGNEKNRRYRWGGRSAAYRPDRGIPLSEMRLDDFLAAPECLRWYPEVEKATVRELNRYIWRVEYFIEQIKTGEEHSEYYGDGGMKHVLNHAKVAVRKFKWELYQRGELD